MTRKAAVGSLIAAFALALLPSTAGAQLPKANDYLLATNVTGLDGPGVRYLSGTSDNNATNTQSTRVGGPTNDLFQPVAAGSSVSEPDTCGLVGGGSRFYDHTVWYQFRAPWNGLVDVTVQSSAFRPVAGLSPYDTATNQLFTTDLGGGVFALRGSHCKIADEISGQLDFRYDPGYPGSDPRDDATYGGAFVRGGSSYKLQIGSVQPSQGVSGGQGTYSLILRYEPDRDGDGVYETAEDPRCINVYGPAAYKGCPASDSDQFNDLDDQCPTVASTIHNGCPDDDHDGVPEKGAGGDACFPENASARDAKRNGCLDWRLMNTSTTGDNDYVVRKTRKGRRTGIKLLHFGVHGLPSGSRVALSCSRHACKSRTKTSSKGKALFFSQKRKERRAGAAKPKSFKPGTKIALRITNAKGLYIGTYLSWQVTKGGWKPTARCLTPTSPSKIARCGTVSLDR